MLTVKLLSCSMQACVAVLCAAQPDTQAALLAVLRNVAGGVAALTAAAGPAALAPPLLRCAGGADAGVAATATACLCDLAAAGGAAACGALAQQGAAALLAGALRSLHPPLLLQSAALLQALAADEGVRGKVRSGTALLFDTSFGISVS